MKIGTRITLTTVTLVLLTLGLYGWVSLRTRRAELTQDLERQMELVGASVRVALEAAEQGADTGKLVARWQDAEPNIRFTYFDIAHARLGMQTPAFVVATRAAATRSGQLPVGTIGPQPTPTVSDDEYIYLPAPPDPTRAHRLQIMTLNKAPFGEHIEVDGKTAYALLEPVRDKEDRVVAAMELMRDEDDMARAMLESRRTIIWALVGLSVLLAGLVWLSTRGVDLQPAQAPGRGHRRRHARRSRARHPARARRRGRRSRRSLQRHDRLAARGARGDPPRRRRQAGARGAPAPLGEAGHHRPARRRHRPRGGHAAQRHRRARAPAREKGGRSRRSRQERRHHRHADAAHHQDHPAAARLRAPAGVDAHARRPALGRQGLPRLPRAPAGDVARRSQAAPVHHRLDAHRRQRRRPLPPEIRSCRATPISCSRSA